MLRRKLQEKDDQLNCILAQHAKDLQKAQNSCTQLHQLNKQLETNLSMSETRLSELQKQYNELLASAGFAESQLKDAIKDVGKHIIFIFCFWNFLIFAMDKSVTISWISGSSEPFRRKFHPKRSMHNRIIRSHLGYSIVWNSVAMYHKTPCSDMVTTSGKVVF